MRVDFDRWESTAVSPRLAKAGVPVVPLGQGFASLFAPTKVLQTAILRGELADNGSPLLRWSAGNTTVIADEAGNIEPVKADRKRNENISTTSSRAAWLWTESCEKRQVERLSR